MREHPADRCIVTSRNWWESRPGQLPGWVRLRDGVGGGLWLRCSQFPGKFPDPELALGCQHYVTQTGDTPACEGAPPT